METEEYIGLFNTDDGRRKWHVRVSAKSSADNQGVVLWLGNYWSKNHLRLKLVDELGITLDRTHDLFYKNPVTPEGRRVHLSETCGNYWLGIARYSFPADWYLSTTPWPGWTHLMHWGMRHSVIPSGGIPFCTENQFCETLSAPGYVFDFLAGLLDRYPEDIRRLTGDIVDHFQIPIGGAGDGILYDHLPWLSPEMGR